MFIQTNPAGFQPMNFDEFIKELAGPLVQVTKLASFVFIQLNVGMLQQYFADENPGFGVWNLAAFIRCFRETVGAVHINCSSWARQRPKKSTTQNGRKPLP